MSRIEDVLEALVFTGRIVTTAALHTQRYVAQTILDGDGDYVRLVKGNQPDRLADIQLLFQERHEVAETLSATETVDAGHGRLEVRRLTACQRTGQQRCETVYGITSLPP